MISSLINIVIGAVLGVALLYAASRIRGLRMPDWIVRLTGGVPWARIQRATYLGADHGEHDIYPVSRHDIAECGLVCPMCKAEVAKRGDFSRVFRAMISGIENEVIKCPGIRPSDDEPCPLWLAASPDTEHGDHLNDDGSVDATGATDRPELFRFVRISAAKALAEKYGVDITADTKNDEHFNATPAGNMGVLVDDRNAPIFLDPDPIDCTYSAGAFSGPGAEVLTRLGAGEKLPWPDRILLSSAGACSVAGPDRMPPRTDEGGRLVLEADTVYTITPTEGARLVGSHYRQFAAQKPCKPEEV